MTHVRRDVSKTTWRINELENTSDANSAEVAVAMIDDFESWFAAFVSEEEPLEDELAAAAVIESWQWRLSDTTDLYVRGRVEGRNYTTGEVVSIDPGQRWMRDRDGKLWRLGRHR